MIADTPADFAIFQNSRTRQTAVWTKEKGEWIKAGEEEYEILSCLAQFIRTTDKPLEVMEGLKIESLKIHKKNNSDEE